MKIISLLDRKYRKKEYILNMLFLLYLLHNP